VTSSLDELTQKVTGGAGVSVDASLSLAVGSLTGELRADRERKQRLAQAIQFIPGITLPFATPGLANPEKLGPKPGFAWAVQRTLITGADTDETALYRGNSVADIQAQNILNGWTAWSSTAATGASAFQGMTFADGAGVWFAVWHPGGKGLILNFGDSVVVGTNSAAGVLVLDVIQIEVSQLPYYLL
jgi:hypothetical protein